MKSFKEELGIDQTRVFFQSGWNASGRTSQDKNIDDTDDTIRQELYNQPKTLQGSF